MGKTIRFNENGLIAIKNRLNEIMVGINGVSHNDVCENVGEEFAPVTEIGQESDNPAMGANFAHMLQKKTAKKDINEGYYSGSNLQNIDLSDVGKVRYSFYFDEEEYQEWLGDNELMDSPESKRKYYAEEYLYDVEYYDYETLHYMDSDDGLCYDDLIELFDDEDVADRILNDCMTNGGGSFETDELYADYSVNLENPYEVNDIAVKMFPHGKYYKGARGFILTNGVMIFTEGEHNEIERIPGMDAGGPGAGKSRFVEMGNIRVLPNSVDIGREPTWEQEMVLKQILKEYDGEEFYLDVCSGGDVIGVTYPSANCNYVLGEIDRFYSEGIRPQGGSFYESKKGKKVIIPEEKLIAIKENIEPEVASSEVDLSSFKKRDTLPPGIWKDEDTLNSKVRLKLLDIADDFWEFVNLSWVEPKGIIITGSICNFNWSKFSDIDLHIVVDFSEVDSKTEFVKQYLDSKKNEWNNEHEGLKIMGFPVELYAQDINDDIEAGGIYDLEENKWVRKPNPHAIKSIGLNKFNIKDKSAEIMTIIDDMYDKLSATDDGYEIDKIGEDAHYLWDKVKDLRKKSLNKNGESGSGNIVYKVLRRTGYLDKLFKLFSRVYDRSNSITEGRLITESQESKSIEAAKRLLIQTGRFDEQQADWMVRYALRKDMPVFSRNPRAGKFIQGVVRMYVNQQIQDATTILKLDDTLRIVSTNEYINQYDRNLNGVSPQELINTFAPIIDDANNRMREEVGSMTFEGGNGYTIVPIMSYRQATEYEEYNEWCLSQTDYNGRRSYDSYTCDGLCQLYFCLKDGFEGIQPVVGENAPLDEYGLSMIAVCVDEQGNLRSCTTRWNHENGGSDKAMNPVQISKVIGLNFYEVFKPHSELTESVKKCLTLLKEEVVLDGSSEDNPYKDRWKAERDALKSFVATYGKLMQSREDNKGGKLYKVYFDKTMSDLIGYNYCICVQWDEQEMKPGSTVYIRALDKFTPFIRRDLQFDDRGRDNVRGNYDDIRY